MPTQSQSFESEFERKLATIAMMFKMAKYDGIESKIERDFIFDIGKRMGLTPAIIQKVDTEQDKFQISPPENEMERMTIFYRLLFLMKVDQLAKKEEVIFLQKMAFRLGIRPQLSEELIQIVLNNMSNQVPEREMLASIRKYLN